MVSTRTVIQGNFRLTCEGQRVQPLTNARGANCCRGIVEKGAKEDAIKHDNIEDDHMQTMPAWLLI